MRFQSLFGCGAVLALCQLVAACESIALYSQCADIVDLFLTAPLGNPEEPEVAVVAAFPEDNAFGRMSFSRCIMVFELIMHVMPDVVNGQKNDIFVSVENKSDRNVTLQNIAGSFHHPETNKLIKNVRGCISIASRDLLTYHTDHYLDVPYPPVGRRKDEVALLIP